MQTAAGSVSAFFVLKSFDRRNGVATYALRVVNRTASALICRTWLVSRSGDAVLAHPVLIEIAPRSTGVARVPVCSPDLGSFDRAIAEIAGEGVHCIVEAPAPAAPKPQRALAMVAATSITVSLILLGCAAALQAASPRIAAFSLAPQTLAGTTVRGEYTAAGSGTLSYSVVAPDGRQIAGGLLQQRSGVLPIAIPASNEPGAYTVQLMMSGPLGTQEQTRVLNTLADKAPPAARVVDKTPPEARISDIWVKPIVAKPGDSVSVGYSASADGGYVRLEGTDGTIWAQQPFARNGQIKLLVPPLPGAREMRVVLHVTKGHTIAQSIAGLVVANDGNAGSGAASVAGDDDPTSAATASGDANGTFQVLERQVRGGGKIHVRIISPRSAMQIALTDDRSHAISRLEVGDEANEVTLRAPRVTAPARYTVVASFTDGFGQESIVAPVMITP